MLRMSFDQDVLENVEERLSVWVHAYANLGLYVWLGSCIHGQALCVRGLVHACTCSCMHVSVLEFMRTHVPTCICVHSTCVHKFELACAHR